MSFLYADNLRIAHKPITGPGSKSQVTHSLCIDHKLLVSHIAGSVKEKPIAFIIASAEPIFSFGANWAASAENCGESAITVRPHNSNKPKINPAGSPVIRGYSNQMAPELNKACRATRKPPIFLLMIPPPIQPRLPIAIILNASQGAALNGKFRVASGCNTNNGVSIQKA